MNHCWPPIAWLSCFHCCPTPCLYPWTKPWTPCAHWGSSWSLWKRERERVRNREPELTESKEKWQRTKSYWDLLQAQTDKERGVMETERQRQRVSNRDRWREQPPMWFFLPFSLLLPGCCLLLLMIVSQHASQQLVLLWVLHTSSFSVMLPLPPTFDSNHWKFFENIPICILYTPI